MGESAPQPKTTFVHNKEKQKKGLAALLLLLLRGKKAPLALLAAALLVLFILGAPFGWSLGAFADYAVGRPGLAWAARIARAADHVLNGRRDADPLYAAGAAGSDSRLYSGDFNAKSYRQQAADLERGAVDPGAMVRGGAALVQEDRQPAKKDEPEARVRPADPDEEGHKASQTVDLGSKMGGGQQALGDLGTAAYGSPDLFKGSVGASIPADMMLARAPDGFKDLKPNALPTPRREKKGRVGKFDAHTVASSLTGNRAKLVFGSKYRYRLALAFTQAEYAETAQAIEPAAIYGRAWATGEMAEKNLGIANEKTITAPMPNLPGSGKGGGMEASINAWDKSVADCGAATTATSPKLSKVTTQMRALSDCIENGCSSKELEDANVDLPEKLNPLDTSWATNVALSARIAEDANWIQSKQGNTPDCCDSGAVNEWNGHSNRLNASIDQFNRVAGKMEDLCGVYNGYQNEMAAGCGASATTAAQVCSKPYQITDDKRPKPLKSCVLHISGFWGSFDICYKWIIWGLLFFTTGLIGAFATFFTMGLGMGIYSSAALAACIGAGALFLTNGHKTIDKFLDGLFNSTDKVEAMPSPDAMKMSDYGPKK